MWVPYRRYLCVPVHLTSLQREDCWRQSNFLSGSGLSFPRCCLLKLSSLLPPPGLLITCLRNIQGKLALFLLSQLQQCPYFTSLASTVLSQFPKSRAAISLRAVPTTTHAPALKCCDPPEIATVKANQKLSELAVPPSNLVILCDSNQVHQTDYSAPGSSLGIMAGHAPSLN